MPRDLGITFIVRYYLYFCVVITFEFSWTFLQTVLFNAKNF